MTRWNVIVTPVIKQGFIAPAVKPVVARARVGSGSNTNTQEPRSVIHMSSEPMTHH